MFIFLCFVFLCFYRVWFSIRDSCLSLSLIGNHTFVAFSHLCFVGSCFLFCVSAPDRTVRCRFALCYFCSSVQILVKIMNTYHAALWSAPSSSDERYRTTHHQRTKQRGKEDWTWEDILDGKGSYMWRRSWPEKIACHGSRSTQQGRRRQLGKGPRITRGQGWH